MSCQNQEVYLPTSSSLSITHKKVNPARDSMGRLFTHKPEYTVPYMEHLKSYTDIYCRGISFFLNQPSLYRVAPRLLNTILRVMGVTISALGEPIIRESIF
jgi:hypothetical protein